MSLETSDTGSEHAKRLRIPPPPQRFRALSERLRLAFERKRIAVALVAVLLLGAEGNSCLFSGSGTGTLTCEGEACLVPGNSGGGAGEEEVVARSNDGETGTKVAITPDEIELHRGGRFTFVAVVTLGTTDGSDETVSWSTTGGHIDDDGNYTAPAAPGLFLVRATSSEDPTAWVEALVRVKQVNITISPGNARLKVGDEQAFTAQVSGTENATVAWSIKEGSGPENGTISSAGRYYAPEVVSGTLTVTIRATSAEDPTARAEAIVTVNDDERIQILLCPFEAILVPNETIRLSATVLNDDEQPSGVDWALVPSPTNGAGGAMLVGNLLIAGDPATFHVRATSRADPSKFADVMVAVIQPAAPSVRGYVSAGQGILTADSPIAIVSTHGAAARQGPGTYRIRGAIDPPDDEPGMAFAWAPRAGRGILGPTDPWAFVDLRADGTFSDIVLAVNPPTNVLGAGDIEMVTFTGGVLAVQPKRVESDWPLEGIGFEGIDAHEVKLQMEKAVGEPPAAVETTVEKKIRAGSLPWAFFTGAELTNAERGIAEQDVAEVTVRSLRGCNEALTVCSEEGPWSEPLELSPAELAGPLVSGTLDVGVNLTQESRGLVMLIDEEGKHFATAVTLDGSGPWSWEIPSDGDGLYRLAAYVDLDGSGVIEPGEPALSERYVVVGGGSVSGISLFVDDAPVRHLVRTTFDQEPRIDIAALSGTETVLRSSLVGGPHGINDRLRYVTDFFSPETFDYRMSLEITGDPQPGDMMRFVFNTMTLNTDGRVRTCSYSVPVPHTPSAVWGLNAEPTPDPETPTINWGAPDQDTAVGRILSVFSVSGGDPDYRAFLNPLVGNHVIESLSPGGSYRIDVESIDASGNRAVTSIYYDAPVP